MPTCGRDPSGCARPAFVARLRLRLSVQDGLNWPIRALIRARVRGYPPHRHRLRAYRGRGVLYVAAGAGAADRDTHQSSRSHTWVLASTWQKVILYFEKMLPGRNERTTSTCVVFVRELKTTPEQRLCTQTYSTHQHHRMPPGDPWPAPPATLPRTLPRGPRQTRCPYCTVPSSSSGWGVAVVRVWVRARPYTVASRRRPPPRPAALALRVRDWPRPPVDRPPATARRCLSFRFWRTM